MKSDADTHASLLAAGNFQEARPEGFPECATPGSFPGAPYHLVRLVDLGEQSGDSLVALLKSDVLTPIRYRDRVQFGMSVVYRKDAPEKQATVGDLAEWALTSIYGPGPRLDEDMSPEERARRIEEWRRIVAETRKQR